MARIRSVKPEFWTDPDIVSMPMATRLFFIGCWNHADDFGVLRDDPDRLRLQIMPADPVDAHEMVDELEAAGLLIRGDRTLTICPKWWRACRTRILPGGYAARRPIPADVRAAIYERDGYRCVTCGTPDRLTLDHIYPFILGGSDEPSNLQTMCHPCNSRKGARI